MDPGALLESVRERLRSPRSCGVPLLDGVIADALRPGKLLRPDLVVHSAAAARGDASDPEVERRVIAGALSVELLHVATLVHDDIIDASAVRRGRPSVVATAGVASAIVIGDLLLARGAAAAAESGAQASESWARALDCMAAGQLREAGLAAAPSFEAHAEYAALKTAELFRASAEIGAHAADAATDVVEAQGAFGFHFGVAFQHVDDLLDAFGDPRRMGKPIGVDVANGVPTAVSLLTELDPTEEVAELVAIELDAARAALPAGPERTELARWGATALRRGFGAALDENHQRSAHHLIAAFGRLEGPSDILRPREP